MAEAKAEPEKKDSVFRPNQTQLAGPQILGTMDVSGMIPGGKHKRKRLEKEKVDVSKQGKQGKENKDNKENKDKKKGGQQGQQAFWMFLCKMGFQLMLFMVYLLVLCLE